MPAFELTRLTRLMNLSNITLPKPKTVEGVHLYVAICDEAAKITEQLDVDDRDGARAPLRAVHLWQREVSRIIASDFDAAKVHFQGTRVHILVYRPVGSPAELCARAIALVHAIDLTTRLVFNDIIGEDAGFTIAAGAAFGDTLATRAGSQGDSELLFLGDAANHGAKAIKKGNRLRVTEGLVTALGEELPDLDLGEADGNYRRATLKQSGVEAAVDKYKLSWSLDKSRGRVQSDADSTTVDAFTVKNATSDIDKNSLGRSNSKLNEAVTLFGDVDGFTAMVEGANTDTAKANLLRLFQVLRKELRAVCVTDFGTLRVQYQGDRIQSLRHLAHDDAEDRALRSVRLAAAWQSSMEEVIANTLTGLAGAHLAIGLSSGPTLVSRLGETGGRDVVCLGKPVRRAAKIEAALDGDEVGISGEIRNALPERVANLFTWDTTKNCYLAKGLRYNDVLNAEAADKLDKSVSARRNPTLVGSSSVRDEPRPRWSA